MTAYDIETANRIWIPQPGDSDAVIRQKREARRAAERGLRLGLGPAAVIFEGMAAGGFQNNGSSAPQRGNRTDDSRGSGGPRILSVEPVE